MAYQSKTGSGGYKFHIVLDSAFRLKPVAHREIQESLANAKVSAQQQCVYEGPSEEIYGK